MQLPEADQSDRVGSLGALKRQDLRSLLQTEAELRGCKTAKMQIMQGYSSRAPECKYRPGNVYDASPLKNSESVHLRAKRKTVIDTQSTSEII